MFGVSFLEVAVIGLVALVVVGPQKLPGMMRTAGEWVGKLRRITSDVRAQTGIDDILREEGIDGVAELRTLLRGQYNLRNSAPSRSTSSSHYSQAPPAPPDLLLEFPVEGADCASALADDLMTVATNDPHTHTPEQAVDTTAPSPDDAPQPADTDITKTAP